MSLFVVYTTALFKITTMLFRELAEISYNKYCASDNDAYCNSLRMLPIDSNYTLLFAASRVSQYTLDLLAYKSLSALYTPQQTNELAEILYDGLKLQELSTTDKIALLTTYQRFQETLAIMPFYMQKDVEITDVVREVTISKMMLAYNKAIVWLSQDKPFPEDDDIEYKLGELLACKMAPALMQSLGYSTDLNALQQAYILFGLSIVQAHNLMPSILRAQEMAKVLLITEGLSRIRLTPNNLSPGF